MDIQDSIFKITPGVQHYNWGGKSFIPALLQQNNREQLPFAELWMGAHNACPVRIEAAHQQYLLQEFINDKKSLLLGKEVAASFGQLPYLFKVLDVNSMLSIQAHPSLTQAQAGFDAEERAGIPLHHPTRNYKDRNHKPEMMIALSDFWLLHGFKTTDAIMQTLQAHEAFHSLIPIFRNEGTEGLYKYVMQMPQHEVNKMLQPLMAAEKMKRTSTRLPKSEAAFWTADFENGDANGNYDRGIFSIYFLQLLNLKKGEAVFQPAGMPHAYLQGQNLEIMAASDNVLRGGFTTKHIDVAELLKTLNFTGRPPYYILPKYVSDQEAVFAPPVPDFALSQIILTEQETYTSTTFSFEIFLLLEGSMVVNSTEFMAGDVFAIAAQTQYTIAAKTPAQIFKAFVPVIH